MICKRSAHKFVEPLIGSFATRLSRRASVRAMRHAFQVGEAAVEPSRSQSSRSLAVLGLLTLVMLCLSTLQEHAHTFVPIGQLRGAALAASLAPAPRMPLPLSAAVPGALSTIASHRENVPSPRAEKHLAGP